MPRPMWSGSLSFGLVNVPVILVSATRDQDVRFHQIVGETHERVEMHRVVAETGDEVEWGEVAKGWETEEGEMIVLTEKDMAAAAPDRTRTVDIEQFVGLEEIDPISFNHPYWLLPAGEGEGAVRAYRLLLDVLQRTGRVAIGRIVMRSKEYLVALREQHGLLSLTTMRFAEEVRNPKDTGAVPGDAEADAPSGREVDDAVALIEEMTDAFEPGRYEDCHRERLLGLIDQKRESGEVEIPDQEPEPEPQTASADLLAALEDSLATARGTKKKPRKAASGSRSKASA